MENSVISIFNVWRACHKPNWWKSSRR